MARPSMISRVEAVTFDDFLTLRYSVGEKEDIICPILKALKREGACVNDERFLREYVKEDELYREKLERTMRESLLDDIVKNALMTCGYKSQKIDEIVREAVDYGLETRRAKWYPGAKKVLLLLRKKGYKLGLISNTHWRVSQGERRKLNEFFDVVMLSYEHGYAKPHPSIFAATLNKLGTNAEQCLHVGDNPIADIQGAKSVGMKTAFIRRKKEKTDADIEIGRIAELTILL